MVIKLDTKAKKVFVDSDIALGELIEFLKNLYPDSWKEFKLVNDRPGFTWSCPSTVPYVSTPYDPGPWVPSGPPFTVTC